MKEFQSTSGADVVINIASLRDVMELKNAITREVAKSGLKLELGADLSSLISAFMFVDSSPAVYSALLTCLIKCTYNKEKITESTFEAESARGDYYEVVLACAEENLRPFFRGWLPS